MWVTNLPCPETDNLDDLKSTVRICHSRWQIENQCFNETVNTWNVDHIYSHSKNTIIVFLLLLFIAVNIFNTFRIRNIKDKSIKAKAFLIDLIKSGFYATKNPLSPNSTNPDITPLHFSILKINHIASVNINTIGVILGTPKSKNSRIFPCGNLDSENGLINYL